jgi:hypothetical protein
MNDAWQALAESQLKKVEKEDILRHLDRNMWTFKRGVQNYLSSVLQFFDTENYENVSLAIAFPSVLPVLTRMERLLLCDIISEMLVDFEFENVYEKKTFKNLLYIRGFLATRATKILYWPQALPIFYRAFISNLIGIKPRNNR